MGIVEGSFKGFCTACIVAFRDVRLKRLKFLESKRFSFQIDRDGMRLLPRHEPTEVRHCACRTPIQPSAGIQHFQCVFTFISAPGFGIVLGVEFMGQNSSVNFNVSVHCEALNPLRKCVQTIVLSIRQWRSRPPNVPPRRRCLEDS